MPSDGVLISSGTFATIHKPMLQRRPNSTELRSWIITTKFFVDSENVSEKLLSCENKNQSDLKTFSLIKFSKVGFVTFACELKTQFCYY